MSRIPSRRLVAAASVAGLVSLASAGSASAAPAQLTQPLTSTARVTVQAEAVSCTNKGSSVSLSGTIALGSQSIKLIFKNNVQGTHTATVTGTATFEVSPAAGSVSVPKQPVNGGVGGNPWISVALKAPNGTSLGSPVVLGRCVQGAKMRVVRDIRLPGTLTSLVSALECSNRGSSLSITSTAANAGLDATILLDNNINKVVHEAEAAGKVTVRFWNGASIRKGGNVGGPGGNPLVYAQALDNGSPVGSETFLGRCIKLGS